jgi:Flp pilus assembly pilin Flp
LAMFPLGEKRPDVGQERGHTESGQVSGEYAIIGGVIALVCIVVLVVFSTGVRGQFQQAGEGAQHAPAQQAPMPAPIPSDTLRWPATTAECEDGGWRNFAQFESEADCREYVDGLTP